MVSAGTWPPLLGPLTTQTELTSGLLWQKARQTLSRTFRDQKQDGGYSRDDGDDDEQLDQRKNTLELP